MLEIGALEQATGMSFEEHLALSNRDWKEVGRDTELDEQLRNFNLLAYAQQLTGENVGYGNTFKNCPVCKHHDCFAVYENGAEPETWSCFSASMSGAGGKHVGGTMIDFLMHTRSLDNKEATKVFLDEFCGIKRTVVSKPIGIQKDPTQKDPEKKSAGRQRAPKVNDIVKAIDEMPFSASLRMNVMEKRPYVMGIAPWSDENKERPFENTDRSHVFAAMQEILPTMKSEDFNRALDIIFDKHKFNPLTEMLDAIRGTWDGTSRLGLGLHEFLGAEDCALTREIETLFFRAARRRAYEPGCKFDHMLVLSGPQGIGKSTYLRKMAINDRYFIDNVTGIGTPAASMLIQGVFIMEIAELASFSKKQIEVIKGWISQQCDDYVPKYVRDKESHPRYFVIAGTTNTLQFLTDPTGNRRFLPVRCGVVEPTRALSELDEWMIQTWAECLERFADDTEPLILPDEVLNALKDVQSDATEEDPRIGMIGEWLDGRMVGDRVCAAQVVQECLQIEPSDGRYKSVTREVNEIMAYNFSQWKRLDGKKKTKDYGVQRVYELLPEVATLFEVGNHE